MLPPLLHFPADVTRIVPSLKSLSYGFVVYLCAASWARESECFHSTVAANWLPVSQLPQTSGLTLLFIADVRAELYLGTSVWLEPIFSYPRFRETSPHIYVALPALAPRNPSFTIPSLFPPLNN